MSLLARGRREVLFAARLLQAYRSGAQTPHALAGAALEAEHFGHVAAIWRALGGGR